MNKKSGYVYDKKEDKVLYEVPYSENGSLTLEVSKVPKGVKVKDKKTTKKLTNNKTEIEKLKEKIKKLNDKLCDEQMENQRLEKYIEYNNESENLEIVALKNYIMSISKWGDFVKKSKDMEDYYRLLNDEDIADESSYKYKYNSLLREKKSEKSEKCIKLKYINGIEFVKVINDYISRVQDVTFKMRLCGSYDNRLQEIVTELDMYFNSNIL